MAEQSPAKWQCVTSRGVQSDGLCPTLKGLKAKHSSALQIVTGTMSDSCSHMLKLSYLRFLPICLTLSVTIMLLTSCRILSVRSPPVIEAKQKLHHFQLHHFPCSSSRALGFVIISSTTKNTSKVVCRAGCQAWREA